MRYFITLLLVTLLLAGCTPYHATRNLPYGPDANQIYDFYEPRCDVAGDPRPALLVVHGGGYTGGDKSWGEDVAEDFCPLGYVVVSINYTLANNTPANAWPQQLTDATAALDYMLDNAAAMKIKPEIAGLGVSAGAHLVAALHLQEDLPLAICAAGPYDFENVTDPGTDDVLCALLGRPPGSPITPAEKALLSPVNWVTPSADVMLIHAKYDPIASYSHSTLFKAALEGVGAAVERVTLDNNSHGGVWKDAIIDMLRWLRSKQ
jgi:acetyl esterase/lipase